MESSHFNMSSRIIHTQCSNRVLENASAPKRQKRNPVPRRPFISKVLEDLVPFLNPPYLAGTFKGPRGGERGEWRSVEMARTRISISRTGAIGDFPAIFHGSHQPSSYFPSASGPRRRIFNIQSHL